MYGLPCTGLLAQELLKQLLERNEYIQSKFTPGLWRHHMRPIQFCLVVNDFSLKYVRQENAEHLYKILAEIYKITTDWGGYTELTLEWDYQKKEIHL